MFGPGVVLGGEWNLPYGRRKPEWQGGFPPCSFPLIPAFQLDLYFSIPGRYLEGTALSTYVMKTAWH